VTPPAAAAGVRRARVAAPPRPRVAPPRPRRISGPVRQPSAQPSRRAAPAAASQERGLALGLLAALGSLASHGAIDRLIRGRIWIGVIAFALIGIVTLQLLVLQLNANIGRALVRESQLQRENAALSIEGSELAGGERVEAKAARLGMQLVPVGSLRFLTSYPPADVARAAAALGKPVSTAAAGASSTAAAGSGEAPASSTATSASPESAEATGSTGEAQRSSEQAQSAGQASTGEASAASSPQAAASATAEAAPAGESTAPAPAPASTPAPAPTGAAGGTEPTGSG
jgi:cell division protein FtsL